MILTCDLVSRIIAFEAYSLCFFRYICRNPKFGVWITLGMSEWCIPFWVTLTLTLTSDLISRFFVSSFLCFSYLEHNIIFFITNNFPQMCLMLDQFFWGHPSGYCDISCCILRSCQLNFLYNGVFLSLKIVFFLVNNADPDEMTHSVAFHLGLHYLLKYLFNSIQNEKG